MAVVVVGMHRSGTSAVASAVEALGLSAGRAEDQLEANAGNPRGYMELARVGSLNDRLLDRLGGGWDRPPAPGAGWAYDSALDPLLHEAEEILASFSGTRYVLKDPRISLLLPFWRRAVLDRCCAVVTLRDPTEVAWSLALRDGMAPALAFALWSRYYRTALNDLSGLPVYICHYGDVVTRTEEMLTDLAEHLRRWGEIGDSAEVAQAAARIEGQLRRNTYPRDDDELASPPEDVTDLDRALRRLAGAHDVFETPTLPAPGRWQTALLEERLRGGRILKGAHMRAAELETGLAEAERRILALEARLSETGSRLAVAERELHRVRQDAEALKGQLAHSQEWAETADKAGRALEQRLHELDLAVAVLSAAARRVDGRHATSAGGPLID